MWLVAHPQEYDGGDEAPVDALGGEEGAERGEGEDAEEGTCGVAILPRSKGFEGRRRKACKWRGKTPSRWRRPILRSNEDLRPLIYLLHVWLGLLPRLFHLLGQTLYCL